MTTLACPSQRHSTQRFVAWASFRIKALGTDGGLVPNRFRGLGFPAEIRDISSPKNRRTNGEHARLKLVTPRNHCARFRPVPPMDEGRKRVIGIMAAILAARKLAQYEGGKKVPATVAAISDAVRWAEEIMQETDRRWTLAKRG
jgi:hypothetical protein